MRHMQSAWFAVACQGTVGKQLIASQIPIDRIEASVAILLCFNFSEFCPDYSPFMVDVGKFGLECR